MLNEQLDLHARAAAGYRSLAPSILSISALLARALPRFPPPMRLPPSPPSQLPTDAAPARSGQLKSNRSRRSFGGPRAAHELHPNCVLADPGAAAVIPAPGRPPTKAALRGGPRHPLLRRGASSEPGLGAPTRRPRARAAPPSGPGPQCAAQASARVPGARGPRCRGLRRRPRPPVPRPAACRLVPGAAQRGPAAQSALTWKCSAIFPGGGAGPRPREPEGRERRRAARRPQPPAGSLRRSLALSPPERRGPRVPSAGRGGA